MPRYVNVWSAVGLLGADTRAHASRVYETSAEALEGHTIPPAPGFVLVGTLDLEHRSGSPAFISRSALQNRAVQESRDAELPADPVLERQV